MKHGILLAAALLCATGVCLSGTWPSGRALGAEKEGDQPAADRWQLDTHRRLLGEHVPYPVEAWPEGNQAHLSAESALYCRVFTEGLFGIRPVSLRSFTCNPRLPQGWPAMSLRQVKAFGRTFDLEVTRAGGDVVVKVHIDGKTLVCAPNTEITLP